MTTEYRSITRPGPRSVNDQRAAQAHARRTAGTPDPKAARLTASSVANAAGEIFDDAPPAPRGPATTAPPS